MSQDNRSFEQAAEEGRRSLTSELFSFVLENKKWWLIPILLVFLTLGTIMVLGSGGLAPFIYTLF
ncbi:MAG: DUF5989 family protein [Planctomycetales bacterium]|nr:DUF5989 family protein [Planctomycetales bacterium]